MCHYTVVVCIKCRKEGSPEVVFCGAQEKDKICISVAKFVELSKKVDRRISPIDRNIKIPYIDVLREKKVYTDGCLRCGEGVYY